MQVIHQGHGVFRGHSGLKATIETEVHMHIGIKH